MIKKGKKTSPNKKQDLTAETSDITLIMEKPKEMSEFLIEEIEEKVTEMGNKLNRIMPLQRFEVSFKEGKNGVGKSKIIETTLGAKFYTGDDFVTKYQHHEILVGIDEVLDRMYKVVRRKADKKKERNKVR